MTFLSISSAASVVVVEVYAEYQLYFVGPVIFKSYSLRYINVDIAEPLAEPPEISTFRGIFLAETLLSGYAVNCRYFL